MRSSNSRSFISSLKSDQISEIVTQFVWVAFDILNFVSIFPSLQLQRGLILGSLINVCFQVSLFTFCKYPREAAQYQASEVLGQLGRHLAPWHFLQVAAAAVVVDHVGAGSD